jgi:hypothetical protein
MDIKHGKCNKCTHRDRSKANDEPNLFSKENFIDPSAILEHLLVLTQVEEMLIARVHIFLEVR